MAPEILLGQEEGDTRVRVTWDDVCEYFEGVMIEAVDPFIGKFQVPGWECKTCGWRVGTLNAPPSHDCPSEGRKQKEKREAAQAREQGGSDGQ